MMECLYLAPNKHDLQACYELMEGLTQLRPQLVQELLESCTSILGDQNEVTWRLVLPTADKIPGPAGARTFQSYLDVALRVEIVNIDKHDILALCTALDIGYDFYSIDGSAPYRGP
jgi:hypothetical protein